MPERLAQVEDPAAIPPPARLPPSGSGAEPPQGQLAQLAGALAALARRVEAQERPVVTRAQRREALEQARDFITELGLPPVYERVQAEVAVARYLTGE